MVSVIYKKSNGKVAGTMTITDEKKLSKLLPPTLNYIIVDSIHPVDRQRQDLMVMDGKIVVKDKRLSLKEELLLQKKECILKIRKLKNMLSDSDYRAIKYSEGLLSEDEYQPIKSIRMEYRNEINELEQELLNINEQLSSTM